MEPFPVIICADLAAVAVISIIPAWILLDRKITYKKLKLTAYMYGLTFLTRFGVELVDQTGFVSGMSLVEKFVNSAIRSFSALSFGTDYTGFLAAGKAFFEAGGRGLWGQVYGIIVLYLSVVAPLCTGALLLGLLTSVLPGLKISLHVRRHKFVFSSLNERSIALAEDLIREGNFEKCFPRKAVHLEGSEPLLIFANAGSGSAGASPAELARRAGTIGAVCVRADVMELSLRHSKSVQYLLMENDAGKNISILSRLLTPDEKGRFRWPVAGAVQGEDEKEEPSTGIYVFVEDMADASMIKRVCAQKKVGTECAMVRTINSEMNTAFNLMNEIPLFLPLLEKTPPVSGTQSSRNKEKRQVDPERGDSIIGGDVQRIRELQVVIIGDDRLAQEIFKAAFWCGQMLNTVLKLQVISSDAERMKEEILGTCPELAESCRAQSPLLKTNPYIPERRNRPYADLDFIQAADVQNLASFPQELIEKTNYFVVAAGSDKINIHIADSLRIEISKRMLAGSMGNPLIAVAVADPALTESVDVRKCSREPQVIPFGDLTTRYSCRNIFMSDFTKYALSTANRYNKSSQRKAQADEYSYWANMARMIHAPYKAFCLGRIIRDTDQACGYTVLTGYRLNDRERDAFAWMEHRRWNAFMRTQGFTLVSGMQYDSLYAASHKHRSVDLKVHNCLVESNMTPRPLPDPASIRTGSFEKAAYDCLDYVTMEAWKKDADLEEGRDDVWARADYKRWDYPEYDESFKALTGT